MLPIVADKTSGICPLTPTFYLAQNFSAPIAKLIVLNRYLEDNSIKDFLQFVENGNELGIEYKTIAHWGETTTIDYYRLCPIDAAGPLILKHGNNFFKFTPERLKQQLASTPLSFAIHFPLFLEKLSTSKEAREELMVFELAFASYFLAEFEKKSNGLKEDLKKYLPLLIDCFDFNELEQLVENKDEMRRFDLDVFEATFIPISFEASLTSEIPLIRDLARQALNN